MAITRNNCAARHPVGNRRALLALLMTTLTASAHAAKLDMFSTDGCSAFPDGTLAQKQLWQACCVAHDLAYWAGGTYADRQAADEAMQECVADVEAPEVAKLMWVGVRLGGSPFFPTSYRWGYGWRYVRGYKPLDETEKQQIMEIIDQLPADAMTPQPRQHYWQWKPWQPQIEN